MSIDIAKARQMISAATPGPWTITHDSNEQCNIYAADRHGQPSGDDWVCLLPHQCVSSIEEARRHDAAFIAYARDALPAALDRIEQLQSALVEALDDASSGEKSMTVARFSELLALAAGEVTP